MSDKPDPAAVRAYDAIHAPGNCEGAIDIIARECALPQVRELIEAIEVMWPTFSSSHSNAPVFDEFDREAAAVPCVEFKQRDWDDIKKKARACREALDGGAK